MNNAIQKTIGQHLESGWQDNPAINMLVNDYAKYHIVLLHQMRLLHRLQDQ